MKIDLSIAITQQIVDRVLQLGATNQIPPFAQFGHLGTHFDVMDKEFPLDNTERSGRIFDVSQVKNRDIEVTDFAIDTIAEKDFVIFYTGFLSATPYGSSGYFANHPQLATSLIKALVEKGVSMIGVDMAGVRLPAEHPQADQFCADHGIFIIENMNNLDMLLRETGGRAFVIHTYPVNYKGLSGLPCRIIAEV